MGIDVSKLSKDSPLRKKIEEKLNEEKTPNIQDEQEKKIIEKKAKELIKPITEFERKKVFHVKPMSRPRMTQSDKWKKRPVVEKYRRFCNQIQRDMKGFALPYYNVWITYYYPMPKSWSNAKKKRHNGRFHQQRPDMDNFTKGLFDALSDEDSVFADARITKVWAYRGVQRIEIRY